MDISEDLAARALVKGLGYKQAPVVYVSETEHWSGYQHGRLQQLV